MECPSLPVELTDRTIDFCHNDKKTLSNCALTHSSWLAASRLHIFRTVTPGVLRRYFQRDTSLFSHEPSSILPYVRTVKIESFQSYEGASRLRNNAQIVYAIRQSYNLENLPVPLVHVRLVQFHQYKQSPRSMIQLFSPISDIVTHVQLLDITFTRPSYIRPFLSSFPQLQYLELESVGFNPSGEADAPEDGIFDGIPLSTMRLATRSMGYVIRGLVKVAGSLSHLDDFRVEYQDDRQRELPQIADAIQERVKCLRLGVSCHPGYGTDDQWRPSEFDVGE